MGTFIRVIGFFNLESPWTTNHWTTAFDDPVFLRSLVNTIILGIGASIVGIAFYSIVSYFVVRTRFVGRSVIDFLTWLPWALPGVLIGIAMLWAVLRSGALVKIIYGTKRGVRETLSILGTIAGVTFRQSCTGAVIGLSNSRSKQYSVD